MNKKGYLYAIGAGLIFTIGALFGAAVSSYYSTPNTAETRQLQGNPRNFLLITNRAGSHTTLIESPDQKGRFNSLNSLEAEVLKSKPAQ